GGGGTRYRCCIGDDDNEGDRVPERRAAEHGITGHALVELTRIYRYPIKSCRRDELQQAEVEPWGLAGDRRWMVVDTDNEVVTARESPQLLHVTPRVDGSGLRLTAPGRPDLIVKIPDGSDLAPVLIWHSRLDAALPSPDVHAWFSDVVGRPVRLVYLDDPR